MIIPMRCFTCGYVLGNKWREYERLVSEKHHGVRSSSGAGAGDATKSRDIMTPIYLDLNVKIRTIHGEALDTLGITRICCRKNMLTHVDLIHKI
jgi:DNA-directed RNA polymerase I, II, and III subunit RPABC5